MELRVPASITYEVEPEEDNNVEKHEIPKKTSPHCFTTARTYCCRTKVYKTYDDSADEV